MKFSWFSKVEEVTFCSFSPPLPLQLACAFNGIWKEKIPLSSPPTSFFAPAGLATCCLKEGGEGKGDLCAKNHGTSFAEKKAAAVKSLKVGGSLDDVEREAGKEKYKRSRPRRIEGEE